MKETKKFFNFKQFITIIVTILVTLIAVEAVVMITASQPSDQGSANQDSTNCTNKSDPDKCLKVSPEDKVERPETPAISTDAVSGTDGKTYISTQSALDTALGALGVERSAVRDVDVDLEYKFGQVYYEVSFEHNQYEYEYYIDAVSGNVLKSFREVDR